MIEVAATTPGAALIQAIGEAAAKYSATLRRTPVVRVRLVGGESFLLYGTEPSSAPDMVAFRIYSDRDPHESVAVDGLLIPPRMILLRVSDVERFELLYEAPPTKRKWWPAGLSGHVNVGVAGLRYDPNKGKT